MAEITQPIQITPTATSGKYSFYPKADGYYMLDPQGVETKIGAVQTANIFGENQQAIENYTTLALSSILPTTYLTLITPNLPLGTYRLGYNFSWSYEDVVGNSAHFTVFDNGVQHNPTDISVETKNIFDKAHVGSFLYLDSISGVHTLELKVHCENIADTTTVYSAYFELWRVK